VERESGYGAASTNARKTLFLVKATVRNEKMSTRTVSASEALVAYRKLQSQSGLKSCAVFQKGVLVSQSELESAARREAER